MESDDRYQWIRQRICKTLEIPTGVFDECFCTQDNKDKLEKFFSKSEEEGSSLYFSLHDSVKSTQLNVDFGKIHHSTTNDSTVSVLTKCVEGYIPTHDVHMNNNNTDSSEYDLSQYMTITVFNSDRYNSIANLIQYIYLPLVDGNEIKSTDNININSNDTDNISILKYELSSNLIKFEQMLRETVRQSQGDSRFIIPSIDIDINNIQIISRNKDIITILESTFEEWTTVINDAVELEMNRNNDKILTPLGEIEFWKKRYAQLSGLYDHINSTYVQQLIQIMILNDNPLLNNFNYHYDNLSKLVIEAKDNIKFLITLERHFKHLQTGSFHMLIETLPSMMNGLRMIWVISRHYNTDERMGTLMEMIADVLVHRIKSEIKLSDILSMENRTARNLINEVRDVLLLWNDTYFRTRKRIEDTSDHRWEFDRKILFGYTDYMTLICSHLMEILDGLEGFKFFLGPQLRSLTGENAFEDVLEMMEDLMKPFHHLDFDEENIFDKLYENEWTGMMKIFRTKVKHIQSILEGFMQDSFNKLKSSEGALELIQTFFHRNTNDGDENTSRNTGQTLSNTNLKRHKQVNTTTSSSSNNGVNTGTEDFIKQQVTDRYRDILHQYIKELSHISDIFHVQCNHPPIYKNYPPIAGAIAWARHLYHKTKRPILRFKTIPDLIACDVWETAKTKYLEFARLVDNYITDLYNDWEEKVPLVIMDKLKQPILKSIHTANIHPSISTIGNPQVTGGGGGGGGTHTLASTSPQIMQSVQSKMSARTDASRTSLGAHSTKDTTTVLSTQITLPPAPYRASFADELELIIKESKYLDKLEFRVPECVLNLTLQETKYRKFIRLLNKKLSEYDKIMNSLQMIEKIILKYHIDEVDTVIKTGFYPLNWLSQRIDHFIEEINQALLLFISIVSQVHKNSIIIQNIVDRIASTQLLVETDYLQMSTNNTLQYIPMELNNLFDILETNRQVRLDELVQEYNSIGDTYLLKIEEIILHSTTGYNNSLHIYYQYWERLLYNAITEMVIRSMASLLGFLQGKESGALIKVHVSMNGKDLLVSPSLTDIDKILTKCVRNMAESAQSFVRWMNGTCIRTEPQMINEDEEPYIFSFYQDISQNNQVVQLALSITSLTNRVSSITNKYLDGWRRYDKVTGLWNPKRKQQIEKLRPTCSNLDSAMSYFQGIQDTVETQAIIKDIDFLQLDMSLVSSNVSRQTQLWKSDYGEVLYTTSHTLMMNVLDRITTYHTQLNAKTDTLEDLKFVLNIVSEINSVTLNVELEILDILERYRTLQRYHITVSEEELSQAKALNDTWKQLYIESRTCDLRLIHVKAQFKDVTSAQDIEFRKKLVDWRNHFLDHGPGISSITLDEGVELLNEYKLTLTKLIKEKQELINAQILFDLSVTPYVTLSQTQTDIEQLDKIYSFYISFKEFQDSMGNSLWSDLDINALQTGTDTYEKQARKFSKELKEIYTFKKVEEKIIQFKESLPLVINLKNDAMKPRHWQKIMEITGVTFDITLRSLILSNIFAMELYKYGSQIEEIINESVQEAKIEQEITKIESYWRNTQLIIVKYKKDGQERGLIVKPSEELKLDLEDHMLNLQTINGSRFVGAFVDRVKKWEKTLSIVNECLDIWFTVQRKWMYLEGIFIGADDIRMQLPEEAKKFDGIDKSFKTIMLTTHKNPNVVEACTTDNRLDTLTVLSDRLDICQKSLSDYLNTKRSSFPRFYFISDDELLSVLGSSDATSIQIHLLKLFDNVKELQFSRNLKFIEGMSSVEKEGFQVRTNVTIEGPIEQWMTSCENEMHASLKQITKEGVFLYASNKRTEWLKLVLGMVGLVGSQIWWTWEVEDTFRQVLAGNKYAMKELESRLTGQLNELVAMVRDKLDPITRKKVNTLLIIDVHARDIVDGFVRESILNSKEFAWESQLRFYWDRDVDDCIIKQCTGQFRYGYEYMGLNGRLVITPLTDRCYMTLTQALTFKLGGSPAGPAGTGKTETTKDLAKSLALPCFVINCGDGLDYKAMASIFSGLVQVGAWGCFDEFNRINIEVLSVVSAQLRAIQNALLTDKPTCNIGIGGDMMIKRVAGFATCGFFITMNPGYAGRTELPDNLKALFRPVTMIVPDLLQICEIMLFSEGFENAKLLAKKMTVLYKLSKEQLSKQYHYDFGLRALKSVLVMAGGLKRQYQEMSEELVLMRCLRDSNLPKFVFEDVPLFRGLIGDLFPGMDCPRVGYESLKDAARADLIKHGYQCSDSVVFNDQIDKVVQMYETQLVRHTTMIVGPTGGGKSLILETLKNARLAAENIVVKISALNPKAQTLNELYGIMDPVTRDWTDGILSKIFRDLNQPLGEGKENEVRWIVYDGDVDALWVENMNSVMDDNKLLTLPNGERIRLQPHCAMICETFDLQYASPATISRCGMVWVDPKNLGYHPYYEKYIRTRYGNSIEISEQHQDIAAFYLHLFEKYVPKCIDMVLLGIVDGQLIPKLNQVITITNLSMVKQLCCLLDAFIPVDNMKLTKDQVEQLYILSIIWSLGGSLLENSRLTFSNYVQKLYMDSLSTQSTVNHNSSASLLTGGSSYYDYFYDLPTSTWKQWSTLVPLYSEPSPFKFYEVMVPTTDSVLYSHILNKVAQLKPTLFIGESGTAKTTIIQKYLASLPPSSYTRLNINFSSRTTSADVQINIEANVEKKTGTTYGPPTGKKLIIFIDDLNMPKVDTYGTQQPIALLHYLMSRQALYDRGKDLNLKVIKDLKFIGAMGPPGGGKNPVDPRFIALFNVFNLTSPSQSVLHSIYSSILNTRYLNFEPDIRNVAAEITACTLDLYNYIIESMPATPAKFHYIFNLRDLSRVYEGLCNATIDIITTPNMFLRLWRHECDRIFCDRLTTQDDQLSYMKKMSEIIVSKFGQFQEDIQKEPVLFGDFRFAPQRLQSEGNFEDIRLYQDLGNYYDVRTIFQSVLDLYNDGKNPMTLVLFEQALEHLCRIHRIIRNPRGNALLVGVGGSGKQSLTKLATYCAGYTLFQINLSRGYGEEQFKNDLKELYKLLGNTEVVFLFTDAHIVEEGFLEFINNMLTTGMVPALYEPDEKDLLCNSVRAEVKAAGLVETPDTLWNYYIDKCRNNLHIVLAMSPSGSKLRVYCRNFPGLISATVIDWFFPWSADALQKVAEHFMADVIIPDEHRYGVIQHLVYAHQNITASASRYAEELRRHYYVTPKNYLDFLNNYRIQLAVNEKTIQQSKKRLEGGLQKLIEASSAVDRMKIDLIEKKAIVDEKTISVQQLIATIQEKTIIANEQQEKASIKQKYAEEQTIIIDQQKREADDALMEALPAVEAASKALENLDKSSLTELKAFAQPPLAVKTLCRQMVYLRPTGEKLEDTWEDAKKMLGNSNLLSLLKNYPKDDIKESQVSKVKKLFTENGGMEASLKKMETASVAGFSLLTWVVAIVKYYDIAKNVEPLRNKVKEMEKAQRTTQKELGEIQEILRKLSIELTDLNTQYKAASTELDTLQTEASIMTKQLNAASKLIEGLTGEKTRWAQDVKMLDMKSVKLIGDCLIGASFLSYLGAFTNDYRHSLIHSKFVPDIESRHIPISIPFSLEVLLCTDTMIQNWISHGLPADGHSIQNGILTTKSSRFPLCIDPQQQAVTWIKRTYHNKNLTIKSLSDNDFMKHLELAIQFGNPFLFENIDEELDPLLDPVLEKNIMKVGTAKMIKLGDKLVEWDDNFRLFFTTKLANPHYSPEVMGKTMIINYGVTMDGLANQLLNVVVAHERPDLEKQWSELVADMNENAQLLVTLEDTLLFELSSSHGNILDNAELIATLENTKTKAIDITQKLSLAEETKKNISIARAEYTPVAKRGSIIYFAESNLTTINTMYELSLDSFLNIFNTALHLSPSNSELSQRLTNMIDTIMRQLYDYTCTGIFEQHKLMFSFQLTCMIMAGDNTFDQIMLDFFLKGDISLDTVTEICPVTWMIESCWKDFLFLSKLQPVFMDIFTHFMNHTQIWKVWFDLETPESTELPEHFTQKLTPLQRLGVMRCFRPDRVYNAVKLFVIEILGEKFVQPPVLDYHRIYQQSSPIAPMVFILSPGADPQSDIQKFCDEMGMSARFKFVALGQGQGPIAEQILDIGSKRGHWILLQNCHLLTSWLKILEKILMTMKDPHKDFRLWLTTEPTDKFPLGILQRSLKIVTEPPDGLKLNMRSTYSRIDTTLLDSCPHWAFRPCLYVLAFLHAVVLERRKYGKIGWNVNYDFNESDFNISRRLLGLYLEKSYEDQDEQLPWGSLKFLIGDAMYGGRVSDDMDRRILKTYLEEYMGDFLFDDCQKFCFSKGGDYEYILPPAGPLDNYTNMIESFALTNSPAVFGLHPNAEIGYYTNAVKAMWINLISLQPRRVSSAEGMSREEYIASIAHDILSKIPIQSIDTGTYDLTYIRTILLQRNQSDIITPCQVVLLQELERWNNLVKKMAISLNNLQKALKGEIGMSDELESLGESLYNGFLPVLWRRLCPNTQKPLGSWMTHFLKRYAQYETWIHHGEPAVMWLAGLHIPESYLTALVQTTCRKRGWPLDKSTLYTVVTQYTADQTHVLQSLDSGCYISGLYIEGASWNLEESVLRTQDPKVLVEELPIMQIIPIEASKLKLQNTFRAPVYVTQDRRNAMGVGLVFEADLSTHEHTSHWVLQGVSLMLNTDS